MSALTINPHMAPATRPMLEDVSAQTAMTPSPNQGTKLPHSPDPQLLRRLVPPVFTVSAGTTVHRVYFRGGPYASTWNSLRYFGPTGARFDHQEPDGAGQPFVQERGIIYVALDVPTVLAEVFQAGRMVDRRRNQPWLVSSPIARDVRLLDLTGTFCVRAGGSMKLVSGPRTHGQNWSRAFYACYGHIEGIYYPSSLTNRPAIALYERVLRTSPFSQAPIFHRALIDALLIDPIREACKDIGYGYL